MNTRCAIYTRKSHEEGLDQDFNSLEAQRLAGENFIASHHQEGWVLNPERYDDGGYSGGTLERPGLQKLFEDIKAKKIDCVVVYKIDRLSRSLLDFTHIVDLFDQYQVSFISITQSFNTSNSMGRLMLNILLSFAQYERELTGERIRDKFALSRSKGLWMGGNPPLGYDIHERKLVVNTHEKNLITHIFERFIVLESVTLLARDLNQAGYRTKSWISRGGHKHQGQPFKKTTLRRILTNPLYKGCVVHKGTLYEGEHEAIISDSLWGQAQGIFKCKEFGSLIRASIQTPALLKGLLQCGSCGTAMTPTYTKRADKSYRYYICSKLNRGSIETCPIGSLAAGEIEATVQHQLLHILKSPEIIARTMDALKEQSEITPNAVTHAFQTIGEIWDELFPFERSRLCTLLLRRITVHPQSLELELKSDGFKTLISESKGTCEVQIN